MQDDPNQRPPLCGWLHEEAARRLFELSGHDLDTLRQTAEKRDFRPVPLNTTMDATLTCKVREQQTANVLGQLMGSDPELRDQYVIFMAHHDHLGRADEPDATGDRIYNGAVDNASGTAALLTIARAFAELPEPPARSILFAAVGAEEQGLLGSKYFAAHPPVAPGKMAAVINMDGINILGRTRDINVIGMGKSSMDSIVQRIAAWQDRFVTPDQFPDKGFFYRSDQFSLAKIGVPAVYLHPGVQVVGQPDNYGRQKREEWIEKHYHQRSDEYRSDWKLEGAVEDAQLLFHVGVEAAEAVDMPAWKSGDEFEPARIKALEAVGVR
jgi:Zn-dependent M28 family amino/carboxypeptidase